MKKYIITCMAALLGVFIAQADNISVENVTMDVDDSGTINISLNNSATDYVSFQMDLYLPDDFKLNKYGNTLSSRFSNGELTIGKQSDGAYRLVATSFTLKPITGTDGVLLTISVKAPSTMAKGTGYIRNILFATSQSASATMADVSFSISAKGNQSLSFSSIPTMTYGDASYVLPTQTEQGQGLIWLIDDNSVATVTGNILTIKGVGTTTVTAAQPGNDLYNVFTEEYALTVEKAPLTIKATDTTITYGDGKPVFEVTYSGFVNGETATALTKQPTVNCDVTSVSAAGTYNIVPADAEAQNYVISYVNGTLTIEKAQLTITANSYTITRGEPLPAYGFTCDGFKNGETSDVLTAQPEPSCSATSDSMPGSYDITFSNAAADNYTISYEKGTLTIKDQTVTFGDPKVETICVANWDTDGDGSLGYMEAAAVTDLGDVFRNSSITSFNELSYFTGLTSIGTSAFEGCNSLISLTIPDNMTSIGDKAFSGCTRLASVTIPNSVTAIGDRAFERCSGLTSVTIPDGVETIAEHAFIFCHGLTSVTIPSSVKSIGNWAFGFCSNLTEVISYIEEPSELESCVFYEAPTSAILYVPVGGKKKYENKNGWEVFNNIVEMGLNPVQDEQMSSIGEQITDDTNLNGNVVNGIYYCIDEEGGGYDGNESCIVLTEPTDDDTMESLMDTDIFSQEFKEKFTGIVFMVSPGKGTVKIVAETSGDMVMKVRIGHEQPLSIQTDGKHESSFNFDVTENTYIYIYGGMNATNAKGIGKLSGENILKIYSIEINNGATGIDCIEHPRQADVTIYNLGGQRMSNVQPGNVYIIREQSGKNRKVLVK